MLYKYWCCYLFLFTIILSCASSAVEKQEEKILVSRTYPENCDTIGKMKTSGQNYKKAIHSMKKNAEKKNANFIMLNSESTTILGGTELHAELFRCSNIKNQLSLLKQKALTGIEKKSSAGRLRLAVMPFKANQGISRNEAIYITERIRSGLISQGGYDVLTNDQIRTMIDMLSMRQLFNSDTCTNCEIDVGKALKCDAMVVGIVSTAFDQITITVRLLDVERQKYIYAVDLQVKTREEIPEAVKELISKLVQ